MQKEVIKYQNKSYNTRYRETNKDIRQNQTEDIDKQFPYTAHQLIQSIYCLIETYFEQHYDTPSLQHIKSMIFSNQQILNILGQVQSKVNLFNISSTISKDRKTSFFRTILNYVKLRNNLGNCKNCQEKENNESTKVEIINRIQKKLNKNTISSQQIKQLYLYWGQQITQYLNSKKCVMDLLTINKSKANKIYYMIHLKQISIYAQNKILHKYKFFKTQNLRTSIQKMIRLFYNVKIKQIQDLDNLIENNFYLQIPSNMQIQE